MASLVQPAPAGSPSGADGRRRGGLPLLQLGLGAGVAALPQLSGGVPKGYLRVLVFNQDSALVDQRTLQLSKDALGNYEVLDTKWLPIAQNGYVTVYVGNESAADVYFDELRIEHRQGLQVQETQYDPAGLELVGLAPPSPGIQGLNNYRFNGKEFQADLGLAWNHQDWRFFDPQLLRWHSVDPELENDQESWTPYSFGYDNAVRYADANGRQGIQGVAPLTFETMVSVVFEQTRIGITPIGPAAVMYGAAVVIMSHSGVPPTGVWATGLDMSSAYAPGGRNYTGPSTTQAPPVPISNRQVDAGSGTRPARRIGDGPTKGRLGNKATKDQIKEVAKEMENRGYEVTGGGGKRPEEHLPGPGSKAKGGSYPDITATKDGRTVRVNTVDTRADGTPTPRETNNAARIRQQTPGDHLLLIPKKL